MNRLLSGVLGLILVAGLAQAAVAGIPDPSLSTVHNIVASPDGNLATSITINGSAGPINGARVELRYPAPVQAALCWCPTQSLPPIIGTTNGSGVVTFNVHGGLCVDPTTFGSGIDVYVNDIFLTTIGQKSPDAVHGTGEPAGFCGVTLTDAVSFTLPLSTNTYSFCHDLNDDGAVGLTDAVVFTPYASLSISCGP